MNKLYVSIPSVNIDQITVLYFQNQEYFQYLRNFLLQNKNVNN